MALRKYAEDSSVPVDRSRAEITKMLKEWGCSGMGWHELFDDGAVELGFVWDPAVVSRVGKNGRNCVHGRWTCDGMHGSPGTTWKDGFSVPVERTLFRVRMRVNEKENIIEVIN